MTENTWTILHRDGGYDDRWRPTFRRFFCCGAISSVQYSADGEGIGKNRLTLRLRDRTCLVDENGRYTSPAEAGIAPGDRITAGNATTPADTVHWRITSVLHTADGIGCGRGWTITAE